MDEVEKKKAIIGLLLDLMRYSHEEDEKLSVAGVIIETNGFLEDNVWDSIKILVGMPLEESEEVFVSDYWYGFAYDYCRKDLSREEAINHIIDWELDFKD